MQWPPDSFRLPAFSGANDEIARLGEPELAR
jgi:hypothetical protein